MNDVLKLYEEVSQEDKKTIDLGESMMAGYLITIYGDAYKSKVVSILAQEQHGFKSDKGVQNGLRASVNKYVIKTTINQKRFKANRLKHDGTILDEYLGRTDD